MSQKDTHDYNVVFEGIGGENSNYKGVRTITSFESKKAFDKWQAETTNQDIVIAEGVSMDEAHRLAGQTSVNARLRAAEAGDAANPAAGDLHFRNMLFALQRDRAAGYNIPMEDPE